ncbi:hypothetical protein [Agrobacterium rubi]|uniref:Uncharacterized protein n=1 Tax=Agrobacterium rubi TaxID=28099 RepID=A0AAE7R7A6_9HYPH|nr:hypothetical protein [Agrobacterium rubi]NTE85632.1 hypothetical protein [Agrobacterium rubi]NTF01564.1 hypothetical protein [Agrobacterium rubi]NTF35807.1 hypothetical protein [Agrobacterium rubi]OCJ48297.1 hypothetical protein A6U92_08905 [Agrobacterium rubi]QTG00917.1 hypothetical protein G6M88_11165 [Agrobacterium rubi]
MAEMVASIEKRGVITMVRLFSVIMAEQAVAARFRRFADGGTVDRDLLTLIASIYFCGFAKNNVKTPQLPYVKRDYLSILAVCCPIVSLGSWRTSDVCIIIIHLLIGIFSCERVVLIIPRAK